MRKNSNFLQNLGIPSISFKKYRKNKEKWLETENNLHRFKPNTTLMGIRRFIHWATNCLVTVNRGGNKQKISRKTGI
jgi:hypothetical protein